MPGCAVYSGEQPCECPHCNYWILSMQSIVCPLPPATHVAWVRGGASSDSVEARGPGVACPTLCSGGRGAVRWCWQHCNGSSNSRTGTVSTVARYPLVLRFALSSVSLAPTTELAVSDCALGVLSHAVPLIFARRALERPSLPFQSGQTHGYHHRRGS